MANTFSKIYIHLVFAVKNREALINKKWKEELNKYIHGIISNKKQKCIIVNGVEDHIHLFIGIRPSICIADLVKEIKTSSSNFINEKRLTSKTFYWQNGYGAFSHSASDINAVYNYISQQEEHHNEQSFQNEFLDILSQNEVEYESQYLFEWIGKSNTNNSK
jgi:REP element-mobilizing transposase RayT